jgi:hypothetical protein
MDITCVTVDCPDPGAVAAFWNAALGWRGVGQAQGPHRAGPADGDGNRLAHLVLGVRGVPA